MKKILSGVQPSGKMHLGNYFGAIKQHIEMQEEYKTFLFIADLHALTTIHDAQKMRELTIELATNYIALGLNPEKTIFFKQSAISEHTELCWILNCITTMPFLQRGHAWKDAVNKKTKTASVGLFTYPVLQAADILLYEPDLVPVGMDQKQHIEMTRDLAENFNNTFGETFKLPEEYIKKEVETVPGTDGQKMSKSYGNTIEIFAEEKELHKQIMSIITDSTPLEEAKNPKKCNIFNIYKLFANKKELEEMNNKYSQGGFGYGESKKILYKKVFDYFSPAREEYNKFKNKKSFIEEILEEGNKKAKKIAEKKLIQVKEKIGMI